MTRFCSPFELPWNCAELAAWSICGMNHYRQGGVRRLFVSMTRANLCITAEGPDEEEVFHKLVIQATALDVMTKTARAAETKGSENAR